MSPKMCTFASFLIYGGKSTHCSLKASCKWCAVLPVRVGSVFFVYGKISRFKCAYFESKC